MKRSFQDALALAARSRQALDPAYWAALEPRFPHDDAAPVVAVTASDLQVHGHVVVPGAVRGARVAATLEALHAVLAAGWPGAFVWMLDAPWRCMEDVRDVVSRVLGGAVVQVPRVWAHGVTRENPQGWPPHQDSRQFSATPQRLTAWLALTEATLRNGCMHVVPPGALTRDFALPRTLSMEDVAALLHTVQALPASPGTVLLWEPTTVHWGGPRTDPDAPERWALSLEFQRADVAATVPVMQPGPLPDFPTRRRAVGASLEVYAAPEREPLASRFVGLCEALLH